MQRHTQRKLKEWQGRVADQRTHGRKDYPAAPSAGRGILKLYKTLLRRSIRGKKRFRACVFGATPETRDLVLQHGGELTTVDISMEMIQKCTAMMKYRGSDHEIIVKGNWLETPLESGYYDVLLGDGVSNNIAFNDQLRLFREIRRLLKSGGHVILREGVLGDPNTRYAAETIDQLFQRGEIHWFDLLMLLRLHSEVTSQNCISRARAEYPMEKFFDSVEYLYHQKRISKNARDVLQGFRNNITHTIFSSEQMERYFKKYFRLLPVRQADDYQFTKTLFIFFFGKVK